MNVKQHFKRNLMFKKRVGFGEMFKQVKVVTIQVQGPEFKPRNPRTHVRQKGER